MDQTVTTAYLGLFTCIKGLLFSEEFKERHRQKPTNFTRQRSLPFVIVIIFLLNLVKRALQDELDEFFKLLDGAEIAVRMVSKSAFIQARKKLKYESFVELNQAQVNYYYNNFDAELWHGLRLVAADGSMSELPDTEENSAHFGVWHPAAGGTCPKARVSQMFDVLNKVTLDAIIAPKEKGERVLAKAHFAHLKTGDLVLLDRGYPAFWLFAFILTQNSVRFTKDFKQQKTALQFSRCNADARQTKPPQLTVANPIYHLLKHFWVTNGIRPKSP